MTISLEEQLLQEVTARLAKVVIAGVVEKVKKLLDEREGDNYLTFDECAKLLGKPSGNSVRVWLNRPAQTQLKALFRRIGRRPKILKSQLTAYLDGGVTR